MAKTTFHSVIFKNEFRALRGRDYRTIQTLFVILFITFLAFGFSKSTLNYQQKLAANPFSNWINLNYHSGTRDSLRALNELISINKFREEYHIRGSYFYNKGMVAVLASLRGSRYVQYEARTIEPTSGIVNDLLKNGLCAKYFPDSVENAFHSEPNGVIISRRLADDMGLDIKSLSFIRIQSPEGDPVPVPVLAVVNELPDLADIIYTNLFYCKTMNPGFYDRENNYYRLYIENMDTAGILAVLKELCIALEIRDPFTVQTTILKTGNRSVLNWKIEIGRQEKELTLQNKNERIARLHSLKGHQYGRYFELSGDSVCDNSSFFHDFLAVEFNDLEKIREFSTYLRASLGLQLNLEVLTARENYLYTGNVAMGAIALMMLLSIISVSIYISGVIRKHLLTIKKNLGTLLAFGVNSSVVTWIYIAVTIKIFVLALVPAFVIADVCGELFEKHLLGKFLALDPAQDYFSLTNSWVAILLVLILSVAFFSTFISVRKILKNTPGDLIYERDV